jgi:dTMP kinase
MRLIIIDGLDGVGKDTHADFIKKRYEKMNKKVIIRSHPNPDNFFGRKAKKALLGTGKINKLRASFYYMFDVLRSIRKYYRRKDIDTLIMVRYLIGTAYLPNRISYYAYSFFRNFVPNSKFMLFLDASPETIIERVKKRDEKEIFETYKDLLVVRKKALNLAKDWNIIDTSGSINDTYAYIELLLDKLDNLYYNKINNVIES